MLIVGKMGTKLRNSINRKVWKLWGSVTKLHANIKHSVFPCDQMDLKACLNMNHARKQRISTCLSSLLMSYFISFDESYWITCTKITIIFWFYYINKKKKMFWVSTNRGCLFSVMHFVVNRCTLVSLPQKYSQSRF